MKQLIGLIVVNQQKTQKMILWEWMKIKALDNQQGFDLHTRYLYGKSANIDQLNWMDCITVFKVLERWNEAFLN